MMTSPRAGPRDEATVPGLTAGKKLFLPAPLGSSKNRDSGLARPTASQEEGNSRHAKAIVSRAFPNSDALKASGGHQVQPAMRELSLRIKASGARALGRRWRMQRSSRSVRSDVK